VAIFDRDAPISSELADAVLASDYARDADVVLWARASNHISKPEADVTRAELDMLLAKRTAKGGPCGAFLYQQYLHDAPFDADTGKQRGELANAADDALDWPADGPHFGDLEGAGASHADGLAFLNAWNTARSNVAGRAADQYVSGIGFDFTTLELDASGTRYFWRSGARPPHDPSSGYVVTQGETITIAGEEFDVDELGDAPFAAVFADDVTFDPPAPFDPTVRLPGETNGEYIARVAKHYSGDSLHVNRAELAQLLSRSSADDPDKAVALATNCATWACSVLFACLAEDAAQERAVLGASFFQANGQSKGDSMGRLVYGLARAYKKNYGTVPPDGAVLHWKTPGVNNDHAGIVDESDDAGVIAAHSNHPDIETTEAGGSDNSVNTGTHTPPYLSWGRALEGWLEPDLLPLRPFMPIVEPRADVVLPAQTDVIGTVTATGTKIV
jgi:hypothetical protein